MPYDNELRELFNSLNARCFDGAIADIEVRWNNNKSRGGVCKYRFKRVKTGKLIEVATYGGGKIMVEETARVYTPHIEISRFLPRDQLEGVMKHEMIHAYLPPSEKHGRYFLEVAYKIGAPRYCSGIREEVVAQIGEHAIPYYFQCPKCGLKSRRFARRPRVNRSCSSCSGGYYNPDFKMTLYKSAQ